ncbi:MAG: PD40 domain-containing protein [Bacteroidia bacterium]|nr:PD40 domain-containing protein [Bacteroidia bacterium]
MYQLKKYKSRNFAIAFALLFISANLLGQKKNVTEKALTKDEIAEMKKTAADFFKGKNYYEASILYSRLAKAESQSTEMNYRAGYSLLNSNADKTKAADYLEFVVQQKDAPKDAQYWLGMANLHSGNYEAAIAAFEKFKAGKPDAKLDVAQAMEWAYNAKDLTKTPLNVKFENLGKNINSPFADYRPVVSADDSVVFFASNRKGNMGNQQDEMGENYTDIWFFTQSDSIKPKAKNPGIILNGEGYDEPCGLNVAADQLLVMRWDQEINGDILKSELKGKSWLKPVSLGKTFETKDVETGACLSPDGKMIVFSSAIKGGSGAKDLYTATLNDNGSWAAPVNMGTSINTKYDEDYPSISADGKVLFFASKGHKSMGGYDVFMCTRPDENSGWSAPVNIGYPLNTTDDNTGIAILPSGLKGYVARITADGFGNTDIYKFTLDKPLFNSNVVVVKCNVVVGATLTASKNARITITKKSTGSTMAELMTNASNGSFTLVLPPGDYDVAIRTEKLGKFDDTLTVTSDATKMYKTFTLQQ